MYYWKASTVLSLHITSQMALRCSCPSLYSHLNSAFSPYLHWILLLQSTHSSITVFSIAASNGSPILLPVSYSISNYCSYRDYSLLTKELTAKWGHAIFSFGGSVTWLRIIFSNVIHLPANFIILIFNSWVIFYYVNVPFCSHTI